MTIVRLQPPLTDDGLVAFIRTQKSATTGEVAKRYGWDDSTARLRLLGLRAQGRLKSELGIYTHAGGGGRCLVWSAEQDASAARTNEGEVG